MTLPPSRPDASRAVRGSLLLALLLAAACGDPTPALTDTTGSASTTDATTTTLAPTTADATLTGALTTESSVGGSETTDGCSFACMSDLPKPAACDLFTQDCPEDEKCTAAASTPYGPRDHTLCVPLVPGPKPPGALCETFGSLNSGRDDCEKGAICLFNDPVDLMGECVPLCGGSTEDLTCPKDHVCLTLSDTLHACFPPSCDPLVQDCEPGRSCMKPNGSPWPVCVQFPTGDEGSFAPCEPFMPDCAPEFVCGWKNEVSEQCETDQCCTPYCDLDAPNCPDPAQSCIALFKNPPSGLEHLGLCGLPP